MPFVRVHPSFLSFTLIFLTHPPLMIGIISINDENDVRPLRTHNIIWSVINNHYCKSTIFGRYKIWRLGQSRSIWRTLIWLSEGHVKSCCFNCLQM